MSNLMDRIKAAKEAKAKEVKVVEKVAEPTEIVAPTPTSEVLPPKKPSIRDILAKQAESINPPKLPKLTPTPAPVVDELAVCEASNKELQRRLDLLQATNKKLASELEGMREVEVKLNALVERIAQLEQGAGNADS